MRELRAGTLAFTVIVVGLVVAATHRRDERGADCGKDDAMPGLVSSHTSVRRIEIADFSAGARHWGSGAADRSAGSATLSAAAVPTGTPNGSCLAARSGAAASTDASAAAGTHAAATRAGRSPATDISAGAGKRTARSSRPPS